MKHRKAFPCACRRRGVLTQFTRPRQPRDTPRRYLALDSSRRRGEPAQRTHLRTKRPWSQRGEPQGGFVPLLNGGNLRNATASPQRFCETALQERRLLSEKLPTQNAPWLSLRRRRTCTHVLSRVSRNGGNLPSGSCLCLCQGTCPPQLLHRNVTVSPRRRYCAYGECLATETPDIGFYNNFAFI